MFSDSINVGTDDCSASLALWDRLCAVLVRRQRLYLLADFDGTLSELANSPHDAMIDRDAGVALRRLYSTGAVNIAIISGRSTDDVAARVNLPVTYAGDHGMEIHGTDFEYVVPESAELRLRLPELCNRLREALSTFRGVLVEGKRFSASVHYRQAHAVNMNRVRTIVDDCVAETGFEVRTGSCVLEIRPRLPWDKGQAALWLLRRWGAEEEQAICIGDDETDEDMFRALPAAVNVRVLGSSEAPSVAGYYVARSGVATFLHGVADLVEGALIDHRSCGSSEPRATRAEPLVASTS